MDGLFSLFYNKLSSTVVDLWLAEPPFILEGPLIGLRAAEGQTINLTCKVFGSPKPRVVWKKGDEQLTGGRYRVMEDGNLEISVSLSASVPPSVDHVYCW